MLDYYLFKQIHDLFVQGEHAEAKSLLLQLQEKYIETCDENTLLKTQIQEFDDVLYLAKNLKYDGFSYWLKTGTIRQGPFCQQCFDKDGLLVRLHEAESGWVCHTCGYRYEPPVQDFDSLRAKPGKHETAKVIPLYK